MHQRSVSLNVRGLEIADTANNLARHVGIEYFKASDGWLWRFRNRHGIGNKVERSESGSANISAVEPFKLKCNRLMKKRLSVIFNCYSSKKLIALNTHHEDVPTRYSFHS